MATRRLKDKAFKPAGKPDLLSVIERRGRTGESYLADNGITTMDQLQTLLESHLTEYDISEKFVALGEAYVLALQPTAPLATVANDNEPDPSSQEEEEEEKPKKRKKNTDKSPE